jgi:hypothetical protein
MARAITIRLVMPLIISAKLSGGVGVLEARAAKGTRLAYFSRISCVCDEYPI